MKNPIGKLDWAFAAGKIPSDSTGPEPEFISHDKIAVLNTSTQVAKVEMVIFFEDQPPIGTFKVKIKPQRLKKIKFNDLVDPSIIQLDRNYSCYLKTNVRVVVQFSRMNTGATSNAEMSFMAFPVDT